MSKRKKTREQKIIADLHRKLHTQSPTSPSATPATPASHVYTYTSVATKPQVAFSSNTTYIKHDLIKTVIVTSTIIISQLTLFYLLKKHIITIPMISF